MPFDVNAPRYLVIRSFQLWLLQWTLWIAIFVFGISRFWIGTAHQYFFSISENVFISLWVDVPTNDVLSNLQNEGLNADYCQNPSAYEYSDGYLLEYTNVSCIQMCQAGYASFNCLSRSDLYTRKQPRAALLHTQLKESITTENFTQNSNYFVPVVGSMNISFTYNFDVIVRGLFGITQVIGHSQKDVLTAVLKKHPDGHYEPYQNIQPSDYVSFTVERMLELAGKADFLDTVNPEAKENTILESQISKGAIGRATGIDLVMTVECFNHDKNYDIGEHDFDDEHVCFVFFTHQPYSYATTEELQHVPGQLVRLRKFTGIGVTTTTSGRYWRWDLAAIVKMFLHLRVFLLYPEWILASLVCYWLGELSSVYRKAIHQNFSTRTSFAGLACRLMASTVAFSELSQAEGDKTTIGMPVFKDRVKRLVQAHKASLSKIEVKRMVDLSFSAIVNYTQGCDFFGRVAAERLLAVSPDAAIDADASGTAWSTSASESASLLELVRFFDSDRPVGFLESVFVEGAFRSLMGWQKALVRRGRMKAEEKVEDDFNPDEWSDQSIPIFRDMEERWSCEQVHLAVCKTLKSIEDMESREHERSELLKRARYFSGCVERMGILPIAFSRCAGATVQAEANSLMDMVKNMNDDVAQLNENLEAIKRGVSLEVAGGLKTWTEREPS